MNSLGWIQLALFFVILLLLTKPLGLYIYKVLDPGEKTFLDPIGKRLEHLFYKILKVDPKSAQTWLGYTLSLVIFSLVTMVASYLLLRNQAYLPLNPQNLPNLSPDLAFNTAA
ncbi:MAG: potassium-transporting ATPase subunit KdpA, partial [Proteobacteria bacterium]